MGILCRLGGHQAAPQVRSNGGVAYGRCRSCATDLILTAAGWRPVPRGYRVVWRSEPPECAADPAQLELDILQPAWPPPGLHRIARPPAPPARALRTGRALGLDHRHRVTA